MGIHISKTPSNCAHKICAFNILYVYSIFQLKRKKCNNKTHLSHKVFQACPCTDPPLLARKSILLSKLSLLLCGAGPPRPGSVQIGPGKRPPFRDATMSLGAWWCSQFPPVWRQQLPLPNLPHTSLGGTRQRGAREAGCSPQGCPVSSWEVTPKWSGTSGQMRSKNLPATSQRGPLLFIWCQNQRGTAVIRIANVPV